MRKNYSKIITLKISSKEAYLIFCALQNRKDSDNILNQIKRKISPRSDFFMGMWRIAKAEGKEE